ncbi:uncharacterized protein LOC144445023 [Glandiceps talaboti]
MFAQLRPSEIQYLQNSIDAFFSDGRHILGTFNDLLYKDITPNDIRCIAVVFWQNEWYVYNGHRRLYLYKRLEKQGVIDEISVWVVQPRNIKWNEVHQKNTSMNGGRSVTIRCDDQFHGKLGHIIKQWKDSQIESDTSGSQYGSECGCRFCPCGWDVYPDTESDSDSDSYLSDYY